MIKDVEAWKSHMRKYLYECYLVTKKNCSLLPNLFELKLFNQNNSSHHLPEYFHHAYHPLCVHFTVL